MNMGKLLWNDTFSVNDQDIDVQHRRLIDLVNELEIAMDHAKQKDMADNILTALARYAQIHFTYEQQRLALHSNPPLTDQQAQLEMLLGNISELRQQRQTGRMEAVLAAFHCLQEWCLRHLQETHQCSVQASTTIGRRSGLEPV